MLLSMVALQSNGRKMVFSINMTRSSECLFEKIYHGTYSNHWASCMVLVVKNPPTNAGDARDMGSVPGSGRSPGGGNGNPQQYSRLKNPMDRGAWLGTILRVGKSQT